MSETAISYGETIWDPASYDAARRRLVPSYDLLYGAVAATVAALPVEPVRVLDLGAGTGLLAAEVLARRPDARLTLLDGDPAMLDRARARFAGRDGVATVHGDLTGELPAGPYDAVVSALAVHHLDDTDKRALFGRVRASLTDSGVFVDLDQVLGPTPELEAAYAVMHERHARAHGSDDPE